MKNSSNSRDQILESALKLFSEKGYDAVSVNEIVQMAGVTKPTLYYFFQSKEGVFKAILEEKYDLLNERLADVAVYEPHIDSYFKDVYPVLLDIIQVYFDFVKTNETFYLMILSFMFAPPTSQTSVMVKEHNEQQYGIIKNLFKDIASIHKNIFGKEYQCAISFIAFINSCIALWYHGDYELDNKNANSILHQFMHGVFA